MKQHLAFLPRIVCVVGAIFDALVLLPMLVPQIGGRLFAIPDFHPGADYRYAMYTGAALMLGWTCLLIWAAFNPRERKGVLLLTAFPGITGLIGAGIYAVSAHLIPLTAMIPTFLVQALLLGLFLLSYHLAGRPKS